MKNVTFTSIRSWILLIILSILAALLVSCGGKESPITVPEGARAGDLVDLETCTYEANKSLNPMLM